MANCHVLADGLTDLLEMSFACNVRILSCDMDRFLSLRRCFLRRRRRVRIAHTGCEFEFTLCLVFRISNLVSSPNTVAFSSTYGNGPRLVSSSGELNFPRDPTNRDFLQTVSNWPHRWWILFTGNVFATEFTSIPLNSLSSSSYIRVK